MLDAPATTQPPAPAAPAAVVAYHDSGAWARDAGRATERAWRIVAAHRGPREALVLDVDDTALSSYACLKAVDFVRAAGHCADRGDLPPVRATLGLYRRARAHGATVFFVTRRRQGLAAVTRTNLRAAGYAGSLRIRLAPDGGTAAAHRAFKSRERARLERAGWRIVANVGDQRSDLTGGHALHAVKLPNPMYLTR